ncbi:sulfurtransferase complex subunit TusB [Pseudomonas granadensis]|uniref:sulfurtransferase complex subunit TusB n=1 Tax=Pseudomonas granadensis TaxID=1421430 RepID=UPI0019D284D8|nr:sulfurtransferase complex subunit TusB [Pseudomonas granadensis]MBN6776412.1 sulfurtransferase complex subunit TusB [Pseudomonas granadensis]MBN6807341.1 sulfurtransferase complex subunit TusB [Pseudomonas granadensis]MBN6834203.1 sulfurtransferase complex subunit TusB [Pseudomonas granadensis]MBN6841716.1 sulfurtransferase complex subunit TusB [Pseudomonas granadensis]MBN6870391.1 sulfurtransferase complex subunit TusB [Pseudomonas granadensis]
MSTLHVLSHSPFGDDRLSSCLRLLGSADALLLSGDAVYALQPDSAPFFALHDKKISLFVLLEDVQARAIEIPDWAEAIDYPAYVELSIHHDKVNSWL